MFFDPDTGDVLICDNDNVSANGIDNSSVYGTPRFMAPEIVMGQAKPSRNTDLYSLAVLLFYMFMMGHPLEGKLEAEIKCMDIHAMNKLYGKNPIFIYDPNDKSNRPVKGYQDNVIIYWELYPQVIRDLFIKSFNQFEKTKRRSTMYKRKTKLSPIHISLIALAILVVIAVIVTFAVKKDEPKEPAAQSGIVYDDSAIEGGWETLSQEEIEQRLNDKVQAGMINISCNTAPYFKDGKSEGNVMLVNELNNLYPQKVEFYRNDTGEKIYESKAIAVGSKIERAKLDVELPAGEYECTAYFSNLDPDSGATLGVAGAIIHITIQN